MCNCIDIEMGSYDNTEIVKLPWNNKEVQIDRCILPQIKRLWSLGVKTEESCCGHNLVEGYIAVSTDSIEIMKLEGYELQKGNDIFYLRS